MKVLMALLDEEALSPPCLNKADLLSEDQPVVSGGEANSFLALFRLGKIFTLTQSSIKRDWAFCSSAAVTLASFKQLQRFLKNCERASVLLY